MNLSKDQRNLAVIIVILASVAGAWWYINQCKQALTAEELTCSTAEKLLPAIDFIPIVLLAGIMVGAIAFYVLSQKTPEKNNTGEKILPLLSTDEKIVFKRLLEKGGEALQSELTHLQGMTKLKSHRAIKKLASKNLVEVENKGKTNNVKITKQFK